jgi:zinc protease
MDNHPASKNPGLLLLLFFAVVGLVQAVSQPQVPFSEHRLKNGLRVVICEDHAVPIVAACVTYDVGSMNERPGRTGFAHLFEHLMFRGSRNVASGLHGVLVHNVGGDINGTTGYDRTNFYEYLPSTQLELALFLEADRMASLTLNQKNLDAEIATVKEERRMRQDNQPYGATWDTVYEVAYKNFAYGHSGIGSMEDLSAATVEDAKDFFGTYYAPGNAVLTVVGDVQTKAALKLVQKYFEKIAAGPKPPAVDLSEPEQTAEQRRTIKDALAPLPQIDIAYHLPPTLDPDNDAATALASVFNDSARAVESLVRQKKLAVEVGAFVSESRGPGLFHISCQVAPDQSPEETERAIYEEIEKLKEAPAEAWEIEMALNQARREYIYPLSEALRRAIALGEYAVYYQNPALINGRLGTLTRNITADNIQRIAKKFLTEQNRTVVVTIPEKAPQSKGGF